MLVYIICLRKLSSHVHNIQNFYSYHRLVREKLLRKILIIHCICLVQLFRYVLFLQHYRWVYINYSNMIWGNIRQMGLLCNRTILIDVLVSTFFVNIVNILFSSLKLNFPWQGTNEATIQIDTKREELRFFNDPLGVFNQLFYVH